MVLLQCPQEEEVLVSLLDQTGGIDGIGQVLRDVGPQKIEAGNTFNSHSVDVDGVVHGPIFPPEVHNELDSFTGVKELVVVSTPQSQVLYLLLSLL